MKFLLFMLPCVPGTLEDRERLRPIARNNERYQQMLDEVRTLVPLAEEVGFDVFGTTEHHFHSEGFEMSVAPLLLYADLAARTSRIKFSPLGLVLPGWDPIRAAEELAVLDHLTKGRVYAGFARGYQDRWVNVLGQQYHATGAPMDGSSLDNHNRAVYQEMVEVIKKAWTQDAFDHDGEYYKVPFPHDGIRRWPPADWTRRYGAPGEIDDDGVLRKTCVVPKPYQDPHPPLFQPFSMSEKTIRYTAEHGVVPWILIGYPPEFQRLCHVYREESKNAGRTLKLGQNVGAFRAVHLGSTEDEAVSLLRDTNFQSFTHYLGEFGFWNALGRTPADVEKYGQEPLPREEWTIERMRDLKYALAGTPAQVRDQIEDLASIHGEGGELEWFGWFFDQGSMPLETAKQQLELFGEHVIRHLR